MERTPARRPLSASPLYGWRKSVSFARISILVAALTFAISGVIWLASPQHLAEMVELSPSPVGLMELRAVYGGCFLGLGTFFLLCALRESWFRPGVVAQICVMGGFVAVRLLTLVLAGPPSVVLVILFAFEAGGLVLGAVALRGLNAVPAA